MLVLSRKLGERIKLGKDITITVTSIARGKVKLGIEAPTDIHIKRAELEDKDYADEHSAH